MVIKYAASSDRCLIEADDNDDVSKRPEQMRKDTVTSVECFRWSHVKCRRYMKKKKCTLIRT